MVSKQTGGVGAYHGPPYAHLMNRRHRAVHTGRRVHAVRTSTLPRAWRGRHQAPQRAGARAGAAGIPHWRSRRWRRGPGANVEGAGGCSDGCVHPCRCLMGSPGCCRACATRGEAGAASLEVGVAVGRCWRRWRGREHAGKGGHAYLAALYSGCQK